MPIRRPVPRLFIILAVWSFLFVSLSGCSTLLPGRAVETVEPVIPPTAKSTSVRVDFPATWTATSTPKISPTRVPNTQTPTPNFPQTLVAQTTVAAGIRCQRHPDAWQVYSGPAASFAGWCQVVGAFGTLYEYKVLAPDGWLVNTFGEFTPNLIFTTGVKNVEVRIHQAFAYNHRNYTGSLEDTPEKAMICDENEKCYGFINPHEVLVRQEIETFPDRKVLILDSTLGGLDIRRYYLILPFRVDKHSSQRLFIIEYIALDQALNAEQNAEFLVKLEMIVRSISQR